MSRRVLPPGGPWERRRLPAFEPPAPLPRVALAVLARQLGLGVILWGCRSPDAVFDIVAGLICLAVLVPSTRWFGRPRPLPWADTWKEAAWLFVGGWCIANILLVLFGLAPWFGGITGTARV